MSPPPAQAASRGFTLVEAIVVMVVIGILATVAMVFIRIPVANYAETVARAELSDQADLAMRRIARDLRLALPNSVRMLRSDGSAIEFMLTKAGGRYLAVDDGAATGTPLSFTDQTVKQFTAIGPTASLTDRIAQNDYVVVNNGLPGTTPTDAYQFGAAQSNIARVNAWALDGSGNLTITLFDNPFGRQAPATPSPGHRFQLVSGPVTYACASDGKGRFTLTRYWNYDIKATGSVPPQGSYRSATLAAGLDQCDDLFTYESGALNVGLVLVKLVLRPRNEDVRPVSLFHQIHVDNTQ